MPMPRVSSLGAKEWTYAQDCHDWTKWTPPQQCDLRDLLESFQCGFSLIREIPRSMRIWIWECWVCFFNKFHRAQIFQPCKAWLIPETTQTFTRVFHGVIELRVIRRNSTCALLNFLALASPIVRRCFFDCRLEKLSSTPFPLWVAKSCTTTKYQWLFRNSPFLRRGLCDLLLSSQQTSLLEVLFRHSTFCKEPS